MLPWMDDVTEKTNTSFNKKGHFPASFQEDSPNFRTFIIFSKMQCHGIAGLIHGALVEAPTGNLITSTPFQSAELT